MSNTKQKNNHIYICVDFDGTMVSHEFPKIGKDIGAWPWLRKIMAAGGKIILFTMRSGDYLDIAVSECHKNGVGLFGVNVNPTQHHWTDSPKAYGNVYVDDAALGVPLVQPSIGRPYVDWNKVGPMLLDMLDYHEPIEIHPPDELEETTYFGNGAIHDDQPEVEVSDA